MTETPMLNSAAALTPEEERLKIRDISLSSESQSREGDVFYIINQRWWQHWNNYVNQGQGNVANGSPTPDSNARVSKRPSGIDNYDLINPASGESEAVELHETLVEGRDYILLPVDVWLQLHAWYGGGPTLARKVICSGLSQMELTVEVYPLRLQLFTTPKGDRTTIRISKKETIGELHRRACEIFNLNSEEVRIWDYYGCKKHALMNELDKTLDDANVQMDQDILVEVLNNTAGGGLNITQSVLSNGSTGRASPFLLEPSKSSLSIAGGLSASKGAFKIYSSELSQSQNLTVPVRGPCNTHGSSGITTRGATNGLTGLMNLGNTCFMNSAIQCLVHTPEFASYFQEDFHREINRQNPMGMVGQLAVAFGELLRKLWAPGRTPVAPRPFKSKLARFAPQFSGYNQHDSQELLAFLLDGLHEDLNRVKHKPYVNSRDADGRPEEEVADEYWANHKARNDSVIVDVCQGQYKSTLVCPVCSKVSVTFDPFMYLSLPVQPTATRSMTVTVFGSDGSTRPIVCTVTVPKQGRCRDLLQVLGAACFLKPNEKLKLAEIRSHLIHRYFEDPLASLSSIKDDDHLAAYKVSKIEKDVTYIQLIHRREEREGANTQSTKGWKPFGTPLILPISLNDATTRGDIQSMVGTMLSPILGAQRARTDNSINGQKATEVSNDIPEARQISKLSGSADDDSNHIQKSLYRKLPLQWVDDNSVCIDLTTAEEKAVKVSLKQAASTLIFFDWSKKLIEKYDIQYLEKLPEVCKSGSSNKRARTEPLSLYTCLEAFLREEPLVPQDMWFCPKCHEQRQASKKLDLWRLPEVLVIHLKRFSFSRSVKHKLETFVNFPISDFDLTKYIANKGNSQRQLYELYASINHYGGMGCGHYTAHIKLLEENRWYNFDDNNISALSEDDVKTGAAYVLFYRRVRTDYHSANNGSL